MKKILLYLFLILLSSTLFGQEQDKHLTFILFIDDKVATRDVTDGMFLIKDSTGTIRDKIAFVYHVGYLSMSSADYKKIFDSKLEYRIFMKFIIIPEISYFFFKFFPCG